MAGIYIHLEQIGIYAGRQQKHSQAIQACNQALCQEVVHYAAAYGSNETVESIYLGGPVHGLPPGVLSKLIETLFAEFDTSNLQEFTVELEPDGVTAERLDLLLSLGVNRIHLLVRSFFDEDLEGLKCTYRSHDLHTVIERLQASAFQRLSIELYYDIEDQPFEYWGANLEKAVHFKIPHISLRTCKESELVGLPRQLTCCFLFPELDEFLQDRFSFAMSYLKEMDYIQYLLMEFSLEAAQCKHSMQHVHQANILGIGPGAHSFWWHGSSNSKAFRWSNVGNIDRYIALLKQRELPVDARSAYGLDQLANDYIMLTIQTPDGIQVEVLDTEYGVDLYSEKIEELAWLESEAWIEPIRNGRICLTDSGRLNSYYIIPKLLLDT